MKASALIAAAREDFFDDTVGALDGEGSRWSDGSLMRRLNDAHREAIYRGLLIRDTTTPRICEIPIVANQAEYQLDPRIIKVRSIQLEWTDGRLTDVPAATAGELSQTIGQDWKSQSGLPLAYCPEGHTIRLARVPNYEHVGFKLKIDCNRYPLATLLAGYSSTLTAAADAGDTSISVAFADSLPDVGEGEEFHLTGPRGTIVVTGKDGNTLQCLPLLVDWSSGDRLIGDSVPELPAPQHSKLLYYVAGMAYLKDDSDVKQSIGYNNQYMGMFAKAFGPEIDHSQRMHNLQSTGSLRFSGIQYPRFSSHANRSGQIG